MDFVWNTSLPFEIWWGSQLIGIKKKPNVSDPRAKWSKIHVSIQNTRKSQKTLFRNFFWGMSWISFEIHPSHSKFDGDHESASCFDLISIIEELSVYFWCTSGQFGFSNSLKVKSELCSSHSFYQFKNIFKRKEEVF